MPEDTFRQEAYDVYVRFVRKEARAAQRAFDNADYPMIHANMGCLVDDNPAHP